MLTVSRASLWLAGTASLLLATACSGPTINGFTISAGPQTVNIAPGGTSTVTVAATTTASSPVSAALVVYNLPGEVSSSPVSPTITTGGSTTVILTAAPNAPAQSNDVQITAYAGLSSASAHITVTVVPSS
jgi:uncharacterized membrane protein